MSQAFKPKETKRTDSERGGPVLNAQKDARDAERIAKLAYSYWEGRGCQGGSPEEDWFRAVEELNGGQTLTT